MNKNAGKSKNGGLQVQVRYTVKGKQSKTRLDANIERVAQEALAQDASERAAGVDVINDFRRPFSFRHLHATKIG